MSTSWTQSTGADGLPSGEGTKVASRIDTKGAFKILLRHQKQNFPLDGQESDERAIWLWKRQEMRSGDNSLRFALEIQNQSLEKFH